MIFRTNLQRTPKQVRVCPAPVFVRVLRTAVPGISTADQIHDFVLLYRILGSICLLYFTSGNFRFGTTDELSTSRVFENSQLEM